MNQQNNFANLLNELELFDFKLKEKVYSKEHLLECLALRIRELILNDTDKLVQLLYTLDVSEDKIKRALDNKNAEPSLLIAELILQRQQEKMHTRALFKKHDNISDDEKW